MYDVWTVVAGLWYALFCYSVEIVVGRHLIRIIRGNANIANAMSINRSKLSICLCLSLKKKPRRLF